MTKKITIELSIGEYEQLAEIAEASSSTIENVVAQCVRCGMPPTLNFVPEEFHEDLLALNKLDDKFLLRIVEGTLPIRGKLDEFQRKADFPALRRTYALSLLRWRGHPVPIPYESYVG